MPQQKLKGKDYSSDVILISNKNKLIYQVRVNIYNFWLSGQYGNNISNIFLFHRTFPSKMMRWTWLLCFDLLPLQYTDLTHEIWRGSWSIYFLSETKEILVMMIIMILMILPRLGKKLKTLEECWFILNSLSESSSE